MDIVNDRQELKPGMYAEFHLPVSGNGAALIVPLSAIVTSTEKKYEVAVNNNRAHWIGVAEGNTRNDSTEVFCNLEAGDKIMFAGNR